MSRRDVLAYGQADASTVAMLSSPDPLGGIERLEDPGEVPFFNAATVVRYPYENFRIIGHKAGGDDAAGSDGVTSIYQEVQYDLMNLRGGHAHRRYIIQLTYQLYGIHADFAAGEFYGTLDNRLDRLIFR